MIVSQQAILGLTLSTLISFLAPLIAFGLCRGRMTLAWRNIAIGAGVFVLFALVLEGALNWYIFVHNAASAAWLRSHSWAYMAYGAGMAALFEETGRYLGLRRFVRGADNTGPAVAYGIGHGGIEAWLVGSLAQGQAVALALLLNSGAPALAHLPAASQRTILTGLTHLDLTMALVGGIERIWALLIQIGLSLLVWRAVTRRELRWLAIAFAAHFLVDCPAALAQLGVISVVQIETFLTAIGITLLGLYFIKLPSRAAKR